MCFEGLRIWGVSFKQAAAELQQLIKKKIYEAKKNNNYLLKTAIKVDEPFKIHAEELMLLLLIKPTEVLSNIPNLQ